MKTELLTALCLGDGSISNPSSLCIRHSTHQKDYIEWKYNLDTKLWRFAPKFYNNCIKDKKYFGYYLLSKNMVEIDKIKIQLYKNDRKYISREILEVLDPQGLAIWFMDDGCVDRPLNKKAMGILNTYCNSLDAEEELIIQKYFKEKWNIQTAINKGHGKYRIRFNNENFIKFVNIIDSYVIDSLKYKINTSTRIDKNELPSLEIRSKSNRLNALIKVANATPKI